MSNRLVKKIIIEGTINAVTGLHIGGTNNSMSIGELDNAVIRNPITRDPYIPGSSLKGKMRSLLEVASGTIGDVSMGRDIKNTPTNNPKHLAAQLFGYTGFKPDIPNDPTAPPAQQPSRIIVRDGRLKDTDLNELLLEVKSETVIDRLTSAAMPRQLERVPAGTNFELNIVLNIYEKDNEVDLIKGLFTALRLVQDDYLGGAGSRGSGQVKFYIDSIKERSNAYYIGDAIEEELLNKEPYSKFLPSFKHSEIESA